MQQPQWKGLRSQKFSPGRRHIQVSNQLGMGFQSNNYPKYEGLRTFIHQPTQQIQYRSSLKTFQDKYISDGKQIDLRGKKPLYLAEQKQRKRPELKHVKGGQQTYNQIQLQGIKTFSYSNKITDHQYQIENKLQRKARILGLQGARNQIGVSSMGDKPYKYPEYAVDFYKGGGLIPGSTHKFHSQRQQFTLDEKKLKSVFTKPHWHVKVKIDEALQEKNVVDSVDQWEKTILKENNPKWNDPETFFQRLQAQGGNNKDPKKAPVKK